MPAVRYFKGAHIFLRVNASSQQWQFYTVTWRCSELFQLFAYHYRSAIASSDSMIDRDFLSCHGTHVFLFVSLCNLPPRSKRCINNDACRRPNDQNSHLAELRDRSMPCCRSRARSYGWPAIDASLAANQCKFWYSIQYTLHLSRQSISISAKRGTYSLSVLVCVFTVTY